MRTIWEVNEIPQEYRQYFEEVQATCGAPWRRVVERETAKPQRNGGAANWIKQQHEQTGQEPRAGGFYDHSSTTIGWQPTCDCRCEHCQGSGVDTEGWQAIEYKECQHCNGTGKPDPIPCTVLDPFAGSGTTGRVAVRLNRQAILCDVSAEYLTEHVPDRTTVQIGLPEINQ